MSGGLNVKLKDLALNELWVTRNIVDAAFVELQHALLSGSEPEHITLSFYTKFFQDRKVSKLSNDDVEMYLDLVDYELDPGLKSWAMGFLIECGIISRVQLLGLRKNTRLAAKHHVFLEREIKARLVKT